MQLQHLSGQLLLATPSLQDPHFRDSVVLICHHDAEGCMGLIINRPQEITVHDVLKDMKLPDVDSTMPSYPAEDAVVFEGGPVEPFRGFVLHDGWHVYESTMQVTPELHLTTSRDVLEELSTEDGPEHFMLILGYTGWDSGQLEQELGHNDWLIIPASHHIIFQEPPEKRWSFGARSVGINKAQLSSQIGHA
ncbi:MAG: YqgE/AlgH family protein [Mariprofundaceae bacterium]